MMISGLLAILASATLVAALGWRDPKRLRNLHAEEPAQSPMPSTQRRLMGWLVPAPGVVLMFLGEWWAFLAWLGALCVAGWVASHVLALQPKPSR
jgi:hypothetical protein